MEIIAPIGRLRAVTAPNPLNRALSIIIQQFISYQFIYVEIPTTQIPQHANECPAPPSPYVRPSHPKDSPRSFVLLK